MNDAWKRYEEEHPEKAGTYMIAFDGYEDDEVAPDVLDYYKLGDELYCERSTLKEGTLEEKLYDSIFNNQVLAMKEGFYELWENDDGTTHAHEVIPTFWRELPEPPKGFRWEE